MFNKNLYFDNPGSLGDAFVFNAIIHHYTTLCKKLYYPAMPQYFETLQCLYKDFPNIEVVMHINVEHAKEFMINNDLIRISAYEHPMVTSYINRKNSEPEHVHVFWPEQVYDNFNILFSKRYTDFKMPSYVEGSFELYNKLVPNGEPYILIHRYTGTHPEGILFDVNSSRQGMPDIMQIEINESITSNMLQLKTLIENATEIHCLASSFFNLVDSIIPQVKGRLFFHDIRKNSLMRVNNRWNNHSWQIINYDLRV